MSFWESLFVALWISGMIFFAVLTVVIVLAAVKLAPWGLLMLPMCVVTLAAYFWCFSKCLDYFIEEE